MEPNAPLLPEELQQEKTHDNKLRFEVIIGALALVIVVLGGVIWYMATHQAPPASNPFGTTTPQTIQASDGPPAAINEDAPYYTITATYPSSTSLKTTAGAAADAKAVEVMKQFELNTIDGFKEEGNFANLTHDDIQILQLDQRKEEVDIDYTKKSGVHTISYIYMIFMDTHGAHPNTYYRTFTFDQKTGTSLDISDVFAPGVDYPTLLSNQTRKVLPSMLAEKLNVSVSEVDTDYINRGTTPDADNFQSWYIEGSDLVIVFPPYQIGPYVLGMQEVRIPMASISSSLNANYR